MADANSILDMLTEKMSADLKGRQGDVITGDEIEFHDSPKMVFPKGMSFSKAIKVLERLKEESETPTQFARKFLYRPDDGANAFYEVLKNRYGMMLGKATHHWLFGLQPAQKRTIVTGFGETKQVPWGDIEVPSLDGLSLNIGATRDKDYGVVFYIVGTGPNKHKAQVEALFNEVEEYLQTNSIYRGQAIIGSEEPEFLDLNTIDRDKIVFSNEVEHILEGTVWAPIRHAATMREEGVSLKRAVLLYGPYGTGKTSTGQITALEAVNNGWTFISAKPGRDKVDDVLRTARLYQPAVVFVEDIDNESSSGESHDVTKLLDAFDGIAAKGGELMVVMTTNHIDRIHKGMLRPGRLDAVVEIAGLDADGIERLIKAVVQPSKLGDDVDYKQVATAMDGFFPAFVREAITRAVTFSISRLGGGADYQIGTPDLVGAAHSLYPQLEALNEAGEGERRPELGVALGNVMKDTLREGMRLNYLGDPIAFETIDANGEPVKK